MQNKRQSSFKRLFGSFTLTALVLIAVIAALYNAQLIKDAVLYYQYSPDTTIASFVSTTGMSERGKFLFYASHPSLEEAAAFNAQCSNHEHPAAVLGCYKGDKIYIYNVVDVRLDGIRPTTAAHEMLHAAYARLSSTEKLRVNALLESEYEKLKDDADLSGRMDFYAVTQPGEHANELHSIIGTEIANISVELEEYYARYFSDRSKVIGQHQQYQALFIELNNRADTLSQQIDTLGEEIKEKRAAYDADASTMQRDIATFNRRAQQGGFESQTAFNRERQLLVARTASLETARDEINTAITNYNALVVELKEVALETETLNRSIDSKLEPAPSV